VAGVRQFTAPSGKTVLVGRNNRGNETLTHEVASNHDLWFHVRGIPGSHTVRSPCPPACAHHTMGRLLAAERS
jgi:predicted ribosome quality control (RQC) complex YloA/Tae2 family protein